MGNIPLWLCIPFAGLLLCIAIFPLVKGEWWDKNKGWAVLIWSLLFIIPFAVKYGAGETAETVLECIVNDYLSFIVLLFGLFCVSGNINLEGDFVGSPRMNTGLLAIGTLLSSCIGTTGASMLLVRPMIQMNSWRRNKSHIMVFFIFLISNMGGCLTPIGDPPLLMGFMRGVPFTWSLRLFPVLVFNMVILLTVFYFIDRRAYRRDIALGMRPDISRPTTTFKVNGLHNIIFMVMIVIPFIIDGIYLSLLILSSIIEVFMVYFLVKRLTQLSNQSAKKYYYIYSILNGISLSLWINFTAPGAVIIAFALTCAYFGLLYTIVKYSKTNFLTMGKVCQAALPMLLIGYIILLFMNVPIYYHIIVILDLIIFTGLILYDMKTIQRIYEECLPEELESQAMKGALLLYLDFINVFLDILMLIADNS